MTKHVVENLVVDSGAFIKRAALHNVGENFYTVDEVVREIRDQATRDWLHSLPYVVKFREPLPEAIKIVTEFARKTGDLNGLSSTDVRLIALAYTLEKEHVGTDHLRNEPTKQVEWVMPGKCADNSVMLPGFYMKKTTSSSVRTSESSSAVAKLSERMADSGVDDGCHGDVSLPTDTALADAGCHGDPSLTSAADVEDSPVDVTTAAGNDCSSVGVKDLVKEQRNVEDAVIPSPDEYSSEGSDNDDDVDEDDDEGWITPGNIEAMKQASKALTQPEATDLSVACVTTDYAMQNVLIQMGLKVISVDGMLIRRTHSKILRCYGCGRVMGDCEREFCIKCGNKTLSRVTVSYNDDGTVQYFLSRHKTFSTRGLRYSLPTPKGGKYAVNPKLVEDQRTPQQRTSKKSKSKVDVFDANFSAVMSPFAPNDVNSRSAALGFTGRRRGPGQRRRNPNENNKHYGHRK